MVMRKTVKAALDMRDRINEMDTVKKLLVSEKAELETLKSKLLAGDVSVMKRIKELEELVEKNVSWVRANAPIIDEALKVS